MVYWKYDLDIFTKDITSTSKFPLLKHIECFVNLLHYGKSVQLKDMKPYRKNKDGLMRYKGMFYLTKYGRIKISFNKGGGKWL